MGKLDLEAQKDDTLTSKPEANEKIEKDDGSSTKPEESGKPVTPSGSLRSILRYSDWKDMVLMTLGTFGCVADGLTMSAMMLVISKLMNAYAITSLSLADIDKYALALLYVALGIGAGSFLEGFCWARTAERQTSRLRWKYLQAVLRQDVGFFERTHGASMTSQVVSSISTDILVIQGVLSEKLPNFIMNIAMFITSQMTALYLCWRLAIVAIPALSMLIIPGIVYGKLLSGLGEKIQEAYSVAGGIVEQAISSIRTVYSYVGEERTVKSYSVALEPTLKLGIKQGLMKGMAIGSIGVTYAVWALQGWYGSILVTDKGVKGGNVFTTGVCIIYGGLALGSSFLNVKHFTEANAAAALILEMIERVPSIDSADQQGKTITEVKGELVFEEIDFAYPSRPGNLVLRKFNLKVVACQTVGLVGSSGSVKENILFGKEEASQEEIVQAAKAANAHNFISQLPNGYDTLVGQLGIQMSEGQKQRISIARALLRDPRILLLDEATSALDSQSEKAVQDAFNQASLGRTTIIVAHRLSALRNADLIAVIQSGEVVEAGSHDQLIQNRHGPYSAMVQLQKTTFMKDEIISEPKGNESHNSTSTTEEAAPTAEIANKLSPQLPSHQTNSNQQSEDHYSPPSIWQLMWMTTPEWKPTLVGCIGALSFGLVQPMSSFCMGALLAVYFINDHDEIRSQTKMYCFAFLAFAIFAFITNVIQHYHFGVMGENLTRRVREASLTKILTFEIEWFDQEHNSTGALCSRLSVDSTMVRTLVADRLSLLTQAISAAALAVILVMMRSMSKKILKAQNKSSELASEAVGNHRIITAFYSQEKVLSLFEVTQKDPMNESLKQSWYAGLGLFTSQFLTSGSAGLIFWYGGRLLYHKEISYKHLFQTFFILVATGRLIAETGSMTADLSKGTNALKSVFMTLERKSKMDPDEIKGIKPEKLIGDIEFKEVDFFYPTRPKQMILMGVSLKVDAGKVVALVGQSGSGKSTVIRMIERFYDPSKGSIEVDGIDIKHYNLRALRLHIALVSQEPTLFAGTIQENIAYAKENASEADIIEAATVANAHEFISSMKDGYATYCGERGVQLSGGQKQRLALARAILKNPAILLLDEATSALDVKLESLVQDALEKTMVGRTCLVVAHRLSTIQKSDKISVIDDGKIVEEGSHGELLAKGEKGAYFSLVKLQQHATVEKRELNLIGRNIQPSKDE
ncbi:putative multidrug resistance protein [Vitis vinifera]|uniref:Putative multidrug resistance protein n=1 Tax=Vitis vinifera TaxID=29760 RepID=A0A438CXE4_VITVI|nr:putative multidrug resistance protein [Vitis vinifera]